MVHDFDQSGKNFLIIGIERSNHCKDLSKSLYQKPK